MTRTRGGVSGICRKRSGVISSAAGTIDGADLCGTGNAGLNAVAQPLGAQPELPDFFNKVAAEGGRCADLAIAARFWNVICGAQCQCPQADFGISSRQRGRHDHDEIALFLEQQRKRSDAIKLRHVNIEHDNIGVDTLELIDGITPGPQGGDHLEIGLGFDPACE